MKRFLLLFCLIPASVFSHREDSQYDEIDEAIAKYVQSIRRKDSIDFDEEKLRRIFGDRSEASEDEAILEEESADQITFHNAGSAVHTVQKGETLFAIARKYGMAPADLIKHNPFLNERPLFIGDKLTVRSSTAKITEKIAEQDEKKLPEKESSSPDNQWKKKKVVEYRVKKYTVVKGDSLSSIARRHKKSLADLLKLNDMKAGDVIHPNQVLIVDRVQITENFRYRNLFILPVEGPVTSGFGRRRNPFMPEVYHFHKGIDLAAPIGTPFHAARDGIVVFSGRMQGYGNVIFIRHKDGYITVYGHNKVNLVKNGDIVRQGQTVGEVGRTGIATGPHLHFEVRKMEEIINPVVALKMLEVIPVSTETAHK
jgi:murein DD-endopeptidase MepM/ murein hydrolase activator NlpD